MCIGDGIGHQRRERPVGSYHCGRGGDAVGGIECDAEVRAGRARQGTGDSGQGRAARAVTQASAGGSTGFNRLLKKGLRYSGIRFQVSEWLEGKRAALAFLT